MLKELGDKISITKQQHSLSEYEIKTLQSISDISSKGKDETIRSLFSKDCPSEKFLNPTWISRFRLDSINL